MTVLPHTFALDAALFCVVACAELLTLSEFAMMSASSKVLTPEQVKLKLRRTGITITAWSKARGYKPHKVYLVLNGQLKGHWGLAHRIAVDLGIKPDTPLDDAQSTAPDEGGNTQKRDAA